jgi:hypothetical protein
MVKKEKYNKEVVQMINDFNELLLNCKENKFSVGQLNFSIISKYYKLLKKIKPINNIEINQIVERLPCHIWILNKFLFEILFWGLAFIGIVLYLIYLPIFKGWFAIFIVIFSIIYIFTRGWILSKEFDFRGVVYELYLIANKNRTEPHR